MTKHELLLSAYQWVVEDDPSRRTTEDQTVIHCWALDQKSQPHLLRIEGFPVFCYIELPSNIRWEGRAGTHSENFVLLVNRLKTIIGESFVKATLERREKLYYYLAGSNFAFIKLEFKNVEAMRNFSFKIKRPINVHGIGAVELKIHEDYIGLDRKMLTAIGLKYTEWFTVTATAVDGRNDHDGGNRYCINPKFPEYRTTWSNIKPADPALTKGLVTRPKILSYDGEMYSDKHKAMPQAITAGHVTYMISCVIQQFQLKETRKYVGIIYGDCNDIPSEKLAHCHIIRVNSEYDLYNEFGKLVREEDPTILAGYNIFDFDNMYFDERIKLDGREWPHFGRTDRKTTLEGRSWESSGFGINNIQTIGAEGRISIDMLTYIKRDYKLRNYRLETVAMHFLKRGKHDVTAVEMFQTVEFFRKAQTRYRQMLEGLELSGLADPFSQKQILVIIALYDPELATIVGEYEVAKKKMTRIMDYCLRDSDIVTDLIDELNVWFSLVSMSSVNGVNIGDIFTRGQQLRLLSLLYNKVANPNRPNKMVLDRQPAKGKSFRGGAVKKPRVGLSKCAIVLDFASLYPSIIRRFNICYTTLIPREYNDKIENKYCNVNEFDEDETDFDDPEDKDPEHGFVDPEAKEAKAPVSRVVHHVNKFIKAEYRRGILPELCDELVNERNDTRKLMKKLKEGSLEYNLLNAKQLALKQTANSIFGFLGTGDKGKLPLMQAAMSITAWGRQLIGIVEQYVTQKYKGSSIVYGDTDSVMIDLGITDYKEADRMGHQLASEINGSEGDAKLGIAPVKGLFEAPLKMEFEKAFAVMLCLTPKRYAGILIDGKTGKPMLDDKDMFLRGLDLAKRDKCPYHYIMYREVLRSILHEKPITTVVDSLGKLVRDMLEGRINYSQFAITQQLGKTYAANSTYFMKTYADTLKRLEIPASPGERLDFIFTRRLDEPLLKKSTEKERSAGDRMMPPKILDEQKDLPYPKGYNPVKMSFTPTLVLATSKDVKAIIANPDIKTKTIDVAYTYYLEKRFAKPIQQLLVVGYPKEIKMLETRGYGFKQSSRHRIIGPDRLLLSWCRAFQCGMSLENVIAVTKRYLEPTKVVLKIA
jgi:DNA polymerase elongation subunit (family B)